MNGFFNLSASESKVIDWWSSTLSPEGFGPTAQYAVEALVAHQRLSEEGEIREIVMPVFFLELSSERYGAFCVVEWKTEIPSFFVGEDEYENEDEDDHETVEVDKRIVGFLLQVNGGKMVMRRLFLVNSNDVRGYLPPLERKRDNYFLTCTGLDWHDSEQPAFVQLYFQWIKKEETDADCDGPQYIEVGRPRIDFLQRGKGRFMRYTPFIPEERSVS